MKTVLPAILILLTASPVLAQDDVLKPTRVSPLRGTGSTLESYEYLPKTPVDIHVKIRKKDATGETESAFGSFGFDGDAARLLFERMVNPVMRKVEVETEAKMAGTHEFRTGEAYGCAKWSWANGRVDYDCYFNFSDVRRGVLSPPSPIE